jgi:hypothetical protein
MTMETLLIIAGLAWLLSRVKGSGMPGLPDESTEGLGGGRTRGGSKLGTDDPNVAGNIPLGTIADNNEDVIANGMEPGRLYLAGANVFARGAALIWAWARGIEPIIIDSQVLVDAYNPELDPPVILAVATPPDYHRGGRALFVATYAGDDDAQAAAEVMDFFRRAPAVMRSGDFGE